MMCPTMWRIGCGIAVTRLREVLPITTPDTDALRNAHKGGAIFITCNRDDFLALRPEGEHPGIIILIRRRTRQAEIAGMQMLLAGPGEKGLANNINYA